MGADALLKLDEVRVDSESGLAGLYAAAAEADEDSPGVLLLHGVDGLRPSLEDGIQRLAQAGYHVLAPDLYAHAGVLAAADEADAQRAWSELPDRPALRALELAAAWLGQRADARSLAVMGFGMGGSLAFMMGCTSKRVAALVSCYGSTLYPELSSTKPAQPLELFLNLDRPYLGLFAETDASVPTEHWQLLSERLLAGHKHHQLEQYAGTRSGFMDPSGANYDEASASAAWQRTLDFLQETL